MTAPTLPEPRPDDEGRVLRLWCNAMVLLSRSGNLSADDFTTAVAEIAQMRALAARLTPHPAPLGATDEGLRPVKWEAVGGEAHERVYVEEAEQRDGTRLYAVRQTGSVLGRDGEWLIMEPLPSSRDEAYIAAYRFATIPEAVAALRAALQAGG